MPGNKPRQAYCREPVKEIVNHLRNRILREKLTVQRVAKSVRLLKLRPPF